MKRIISFLIAAAVCVSCLSLGVCAEKVKYPVYCNVEGFEDFYYFPVKACDGKTYYMYVCNFGDGCSFLMDSDGWMSGFMYRSVLAVNLPAKRYENISLKKMNELLGKYDFAKMEGSVWNKDIPAEKVNRRIAVMKELKLTGKFDGDVSALSPAPYYEKKLELFKEIVDLELYHSIEAEFFSYNGRTVVKLSGEEFSALSELAEKNKKTVAKYSQVKKAYYDSAGFEGYFYCDPKPLDDYIGKADKEPLKAPAEYFKNEYSAELPEENFKGRTIDDFIGSDTKGLKDSDYFVYGAAAVCPPEGSLCDCDYISYSSLRFRYGDNIDFTVREISKKEADLPQSGIRSDLTGTLFGNKCRYYERLMTKKYYTASLVFSIDGKYYIAQAGANSLVWGGDFRKVWREFFGSIKPASKLEKLKFGKAPEKYFKDVKVSAKSMKSAVGKLKLYVPDGLKCDGWDEYFSAYKDNEHLNISVRKESAATGVNLHREVLHRHYDHMEGMCSKTKKLYNFRRNGHDCTLVIREEMKKFELGWETEYIYYIDCGKDFYTVTVTQTAKSKSTLNDVIKVLSSVKV